jgi:hypothetical protein
LNARCPIQSRTVPSSGGADLSVILSPIWWGCSMPLSLRFLPELLGAEV